VVKNENQMFIQPLVNEKPAHVLGILQHPRTLATFSDSGAHVCQEMGSSLQTHMLNYWVRQKQAFTLENAVKMLTLDNALAWDIVGRGLIRENYAADLVLFEEGQIRPQIPKVHHDLPGGAPRLVQKSEGIAYTVVNGQVTLENGCATGEHSGQVVKGRLASTH
jgi:N-acyl-D-aspartate/D-glutamate deacylase